MTELEIIVENKLGIHARPAALIVKAATRFQSEITLEKEGEGISANAKSIMSVMMLAAASGSKIKIKAKGKDEEKAVEAIAELFRGNFNEE
jgi:phosphocarrier protein